MFLVKTEIQNSIRSVQFSNICQILPIFIMVLAKVIKKVKNPKVANSPTLPAGQLPLGSKSIFPAKTEDKLEHNKINSIMFTSEM